MYKKIYFGRYFSAKLNNISELTGFTNFSVLGRSGRLSIISALAEMKIKGVSFWRNGQVQTNNQSEIIKLDEYPTFSAQYSLYPPIEITRGCPFGCARNLPSRPWLF